MLTNGDKNKICGMCLLTGTPDDKALSALKLLGEYFLGTESLEYMPDDRMGIILVYDIFCIIGHPEYCSDVPYAWAGHPQKLFGALAAHLHVSNGNYRTLPDIDTSYDTVNAICRHIIDTHPYRGHHWWNREDRLLPRLWFSLFRRQYRVVTVS